MKKICFCTAGASPALTHARNKLLSWGYDVTAEPGKDVTHLLLSVPSLDESGMIRGGPSLEQLLTMLPEDVTVLGGMLPPLPRNTVDFLRDEYYLAENAAITAQCALSLTYSHLEKTMTGQPVLVIGWGRIGKCLAPLLHALGAEVTVAVRKLSDAAMLSALGYRAVSTEELGAENFRIIYNTAPAPVLHRKDTHPDALIIDLASIKGIEGDNVLWARGLPGKIAPETSGALIAKTALRYALRKE